MDGCEYSLEIIIVPQKGRTVETNFLEINMLLPKRLLKQWMTARFPVKINTVSFKEWITLLFL